MDKLRIAICDDEHEEYEQLTDMLRKTPFPWRGDYYASGEDLLKDYYPGKYDLFILDIYMQGMTGVELASQIRRSDSNVVMAFLTTSPDHALDGYRVHVNRYILKPFDEKDINELIRLAYERKMFLPSMIIPVNRKEIQIPYARIRYMESAKHHVKVYLTGGEILQTGMKLTELMEIMPSPPFYQCHKSYLVNLDHVSFLNKELSMFEMKGSGNVYIRRGSLREAEKIYKKYMFELTRRQENE